MAQGRTGHGEFITGKSTGQSRHPSSALNAGRFVIGIALLTPLGLASTATYMAARWGQAPTRQRIIFPCPAWGWPTCPRS